jgi:endonuclease-3
MQRKIEQVIPERIASADLLVQPKCEVCQWPRLPRTPHFQPAHRRSQDRIRENGIIVKVKARPQRSPKGSQRSAEKKKPLAHVQVRAYVKRPKNAAERQARVAEILRILDEMYPAATCALRHNNPWQLLVATILSAQCTDKRVNEVTPGLFAKYPTPQDFAAVRPEVLAQDIRSTGFFNNKAKSIVGAANKIVHQFAGQVPRTMEEMLTIPGAARKTSNVVLGTAYGIASGVVVDTHVQRISHRLDLTKHTDPVKIEQDLKKLLPQDRWIRFSHQIILHGRALCIARNPKCHECQLNPLCYAKDKQV